MKAFFITTSILIALGMVSVSAKAKASGKVQTLKIVDTDSAESIAGPVETFTGKVRITMVLQPEDSKSTSCASVAFEPGARSAWHSHPKGQLLVVTDGATPETAIIHTAIQEYLNGKNVNWMEKVTDAEYAGKAQ